MRQIFVFGSNLAGRHGKGAALEARQKYAAIYGQGIGLQGDSYALPTKDEWFKPLSLRAIHYHIAVMINCARAHPEMQFNITRIGCGLAGYNWIKDIYPLFPSEIPPNCKFI